MPSTASGSGPSSWTLTFDPWITSVCRSRKSTSVERPVFGQWTPAAPNINTRMWLSTSLVLAFAMVVWKWRFGYDDLPLAGLRRKGVGAHEENRGDYQAVQTGRGQGRLDRTGSLWHDRLGSPRVRPPKGTQGGLPGNRIHHRVCAEDQDRGRRRRQVSGQSDRDDHPDGQDRQHRRRKDLCLQPGRSGADPHRRNRRPRPVTAYVGSSPQAGPQRPVDQRRPSRASLVGRRQAIAAAHARGASGVETVTALTALADDILRDHYALEYAGTFSPAGVVLVALGGYGRRELAPSSDIDLMFLYEPLHEREARAVSAAILHVLWDLGFLVGHSLRTIADCRSMGRTDLTVRTSLMEARWLAGDQALFDEFTRTYREQVSGKRVQDYVAHKLGERQEEYGKYGSTNFLLEPNIKKSRGGLRDLHLLKWTALARYETSSFEDLSAVGLLSAGDVAALWDAQEFFWRVRNELHFFALRAQDIVTFDEQIRIAGLWGFKDLPHLLAVEQFMQQYYRHSTRVCDITSRFVSQAMQRSVWQ